MTDGYYSRDHLFAPSHWQTCVTISQSAHELHSRTTGFSTGDTLRVLHLCCGRVAEFVGF